MTTPPQTPIEHAKALARELQRKGDYPVYGHALDAVARQNGFKDWNRLCAAMKGKQ